MQQAIKYVLVELIVTVAATNNRTFTFVPQEFLRKKKIVSISAYNSDDIPLSPNTGNAVISPANFNASFITLYGADPDSEYNQQPLGSNPTPVQGDWLKQIPLVEIHRVVGTNPYVRDLMEFEPRYITWELSKVECPQDLGLTTTNTSYLFLVGYTGLQTSNS